MMKQRNDETIRSTNENGLLGSWLEVMVRFVEPAA
jgi:hypothetical protein